jgi:transposase
MVRGAATSEDVRKIIVKQYCQGNTVRSVRQVAESLNIAKSTVFNVLKHYRENGDVVVKGKSPGRPRLVSSRNQRSLIKLCTKGRRNTLRDITAQWNEESGLKLSRECCRQWIHKSGLKFYKVRHKDFVHFQFKSNFLKHEG